MPGLTIQIVWPDLHLIPLNPQRRNTMLIEGQVLLKEKEKKRARVLAWIKHPTISAPFHQLLALLESMEGKKNKNIFQWFLNHNQSTFFPQSSEMFSWIFNFHVTKSLFDSQMDQLRQSFRIFTIKLNISRENKEEDFWDAAVLLTTGSPTNFALRKKNWQICLFFVWIFLYRTLPIFPLVLFAFFFAVASKYFQLGSRWTQCYYFGRHTHSHTHTYTHTADVYYWHSQPPTQAIMLPKRSRTEIGRRKGGKKKGGGLLLIIIVPRHCHINREKYIWEKSYDIQCLLLRHIIWLGPCQGRSLKNWREGKTNMKLSIWKLMYLFMCATAVFGGWPITLRDDTTCCAVEADSLWEAGREWNLTRQHIISTFNYVERLWITNKFTH